MKLWGISSKAFDQLAMESNHISFRIASIASERPVALSLLLLKMI